MKFINKIVATFVAGIVLFSCTKQTTDTYERFVFRNDGADLAVEINGNMGSKIFILLLHGGPGGGSGAYNSGRYSEMLEEKYAVVYMDQRGNGASQGAYSVDDLTLAQNSKDVYALTLFLKKKYGNDISLFLMGHSWGGITSSHALTNTEIQKELKGWIEVDGVNDFDHNNVEAIKLFIEVGEAQLTKGYEVEFWQEIVDRVKVMDTTAVTDDAEGYLNSKGFEAEGKLEEITNPEDNSTPGYSIINSPDIALNLKASNNFINGTLNNDSKSNSTRFDLEKITIPSQFLWGKFDFVVPPEVGVDAYNRVSSLSKEIIIFENSGHSPMSNEPVKFSQSIIDFIELHK
ncbi:MAG: alpha/beta fold hydrolase [Crocinitomicaceae bacterium]